MKHKKRPQNDGARLKFRRDVIFSILSDSPDKKLNSFSLHRYWGDSIHREHSDEREATGVSKNITVPGGLKSYINPKISGYVPSRHSDFHW